MFLSYFYYCLETKSLTVGLPFSAVIWPVSSQDLFIYTPEYGFYRHWLVLRNLLSLPSRLELQASYPLSIYTGVMDLNSGPLEYIPITLAT